MIIPVSALSEDTLHRLLADFATRDGTYVGDGPEPDLADKIRHLRTLLKKGELHITFDDYTESLSLATSDALRNEEHS